MIRVVTQYRETGCGSAWLERLVWDQEVAGSNPVTPMLKQQEIAAFFVIFFI